MPNFSLNIDGENIPHSGQTKYIGVTIEKCLKWNTHVINVVRKANKVLGIIRRCLGPAQTKTCMNAFNSVVRPILEYASQVSAPHNASLSKDLDMVQRRAVRWAYRLAKTDSVTDTMQNHNIVPLSVRRYDPDLLFPQFLAKLE